MAVYLWYFYSDVDVQKESTAIEEQKKDSQNS